MVLALAIVGLTYAVFAGLPFGEKFEVRGVFSSANQLRSGSDVRIAGLRIGEVERIEQGPDHTSIAVMRIDDRGVPIRTDATLAILPRLALEGNDYVKVNPGTPSAPELRSGATIPLERTTVAVQLNQVLDVLTRPTRNALKSTFAELARGLGTGRDGSQGSSRAGHEGLRRAVRELDGAVLSISQVARASRGTRPGDLRRAIGSSGNFAAQLAQDPAALADFVTNYNRVFGALAGHDRALAASIRELDGVLRVAPASLRSVDAALPALTRFTQALRPTLRAAPVTLRKANGALTQLELLMRDRELPSLLTALEPVSANLPTLNRRLGSLLPLVTPVSKCVSQNVIPTFNQTIEDGPRTSGQPVWQEFLHMGAGLAGIAQGFDGNGTTLRLGVSQDERTVTYNLPGVGEVMTRGAIEGVSPTWLGFGVDPQYRPDARCIDQEVPNLNIPSRKSGPPPRPSSMVAQPPTATERSLRAALLEQDSTEVLRGLRELTREHQRRGGRG
ncbi:MAG: MlaD family protein [Thermoleophilaceae bacterium]